MRNAQEIYDYFNLHKGLSRRFVTHTWVRGSDSIDDYGRWYDGVNKEADQRLLEHKVRWYYRHRSRSLRLCTLVFPFAPSKEQLIAGTRPHIHTLIIDSVSPSEEQARWRSALLDHALNNDEKRIEPNFLANKLREPQERKEGTLGKVHSVAYDPDLNAVWYCTNRHDQLDSYQTWSRRKRFFDFIHHH